MLILNVFFRKTSHQIKNSDNIQPEWKWRLCHFIHLAMLQYYQFGKFSISLHCGGKLGIFHRYIDVGLALILYQELCFGTVTYTWPLELSPIIIPRHCYCCLPLVSVTIYHHSENSLLIFSQHCWHLSSLINVTIALPLVPLPFFVTHKYHHCLSLSTVDIIHQP